jgi:hypothetical protein
MQRYNGAKELKCSQRRATCNVNSVTPKCKRVEEEDRENGNARCKEDLGHSHGVPEKIRDLKSGG